jgi:hypothetical protein
MRIFFRFSFLVFIGFLSACKYGSQNQTINTGNFSILIPDWLKAQDNLKPGAEFQYANRFRNFYAIGETLNKTQLSDSLQTIMNANLQILKKAMKKPVVTDSTGISINGLDGLRVEIYGQMNDENIYFSEVLLRGKNHIYHLSIWTRGAERKLRFNKDIDSIFNSFHEKGV